YVGPTETVYEGDIVRIRPAEEDIESLISELTYFMPGLPVARSDVLQAWAGLRPMTYNPAYPTGQRMPFSVVYDLEKEGFPKAATMSWAAFMLHKETARKFVKLVSRKIGPSGHRLP